MIGQYLSNTNESATISILQKNLEVNKALDCSAHVVSSRHSLAMAETSFS